jgi:hypothetical protein
MALLDEIKELNEKVKEFSYSQPKDKLAEEDKKLEKEQQLLQFQSLMTQVNAFVSISLKIEVLYTEYFKALKLKERKNDEIFVFKCLMSTFVTAVETLTETYKAFSRSFKKSLDNESQRELVLKKEYIDSMGSFLLKSKQTKFKLIEDLDILSHAIEDINIPQYAQDLKTNQDNVQKKMPYIELDRQFNAIRDLYSELQQAKFNTPLNQDNDILTKETTASLIEQSGKIIDFLSKIEKLHAQHKNFLLKNEDFQIRKYYKNPAIENVVMLYKKTLFEKTELFLSNTEKMLFSAKNKDYSSESLCELQDNLAELRVFVQKERAAAAAAKSKAVIKKKIEKIEEIEEKISKLRKKLDEYNPNLLPNENLSEEGKMAHFNEQSEKIISFFEINSLNAEHENFLLNEDIGIKNDPINARIKEAVASYKIGLLEKVKIFLSNNEEMLSFAKRKDHPEELFEDVTGPLIRLKINIVDLSQYVETEEKAAAAASKAVNKEEIEEVAELDATDQKKQDPRLSPSNPPHMNKKAAALMTSSCTLGGGMVGAGFIGLMVTLSNTAIIAAGTGALAGGVMGGPIGVVIGTVIGLLAGLALGSFAVGFCYHFFPKPKEPNNKNNKKLDYSSENPPRDESTSTFSWQE